MAHLARNPVRYHDVKVERRQIHKKEREEQILVDQNTEKC